MLRHDKKLSAAWKKKDKRLFEIILADRIKQAILRDAEENGWTMDDILGMIDFRWKRKKEKRG